MSGTEDFTPEETAALGEMREAVTTTGPGPEPEPEVVTSEPAPQPAKGPERGPDGKFQPKATEAPADAEAAPAEAQEPAKPEAVKPPEGFVPHGAMHQERERAKAAEARASALEARLAEIEAAKAQQPPEPWPDPISDPDAYNARLQKELSARDERLEAMQRQAQEAQYRQGVISAIASHSQEFQQRTPDFTEAINHAVETAKAELLYWNPGATEEQVMAKINADVEAIAAQALRNGKNVAEALYQVAKWRGYQGQPAPAQPPAQTQQPADAARKVEALAAAQRATESLGAAPIAAGANELTIESLAKMSEAEVARLQRERPRDVARALGA